MKTDATHDIYVATLNSEGVLLAEMAEMGFDNIPEFPLSSFFNANFVRQVRACAAYLRENKIDLVHTHDFYTNVFGMAAARLAGVEVKLTSKRETGGMRSNAQEFVEKLAFGRADAIVANSAAVRQHLVECGISNDKLKVIYNGLDLTRFENINELDREKYGLPSDENTRFITLVANLRHEVKNVPMFLRAAKAVSQAVPKTHFVIAGEGDLKNELKATAAATSIAENVHFIGRCSDIPALLSASYACALTSTAEGFSNSILEYMAAGKPVIATNVGGAAEAIVENETGHLVASDDDETMALRLIDLLDDDRKAKRFGAAGKQCVADKFFEGDQLSSTLELYNSFLK